jgi:uncharacterized protein YcbK (DUF882 family)
VELAMNNLITPNFTWSEFACKDGINVPDLYKPNVVLLCQQLELIREKLKVPILILSGFRTVSYNDLLRLKDTKVAKNSQHLLGKAADIQAFAYNSLQIFYTILKLMNTNKIIKGGLGLYNNFVHYDIRGTQITWDYTN